MAELSVVEEREIGAPADKVYGYIADLRQHHQHFLPPSFGELRIEEGGYGAGTIYRVDVTFAGSTRKLHMRMEEPVPGKVITEADLHTPMVTTWTLTPNGATCRVSIATVWTSVSGPAGLVERLFAPGVMRKTYRDELNRLDQYAREQASVV